MKRIRKAFSPGRDSANDEDESSIFMPPNVEENTKVDDELTELRVKVAYLNKMINDATAPAQNLGKLWILPGVVGVVIVMIGLSILFLAFTQIQTARFDDALWGGVVLVAIGAFSSTATALFVKPSASESASASARSWAALSEDLSEEDRGRFSRVRSSSNSKHQRS